MAGRARQEAPACYAAAGIGHASDEEMRARESGIVTYRPVHGREWLVSSSVQSVARGTGSLKCDYLNSEIVLLGRACAVPTPVNKLRQRLAGDLARQRRQPGALSEPELRELANRHPRPRPKDRLRGPGRLRPDPPSRINVRRSQSRPQPPQHPGDAFLT